MKSEKELLQFPQIILCSFQFEERKKVNERKKEEPVIIR